MRVRTKVIYEAENPEGKRVVCYAEYEGVGARIARPQEVIYEVEKPESKRAVCYAEHESVGARIARPHEGNL